MDGGLIGLGTKARTVSRIQRWSISRGAKLRGLDPGPGYPSERFCHRGLNSRGAPRRLADRPGTLDISDHDEGWSPECWPAATSRPAGVPRERPAGRKSARSTSGKRGTTCASSSYGSIWPPAPMIPTDRATGEGSCGCGVAASAHHLIPAHSSRHLSLEAPYQPLLESCTMRTMHLSRVRTEVSTARSHGELWAVAYALHSACVIERGGVRG